MKLYVIRHGQTNWNLKGIIQGQKDIELNDKGINEARKAKDEFNSLKIDLIMCSPLKRAKETVSSFINYIFNNIPSQLKGDKELNFSMEISTTQIDIFKQHQDFYTEIKPYINVINDMQSILNEENILGLRMIMSEEQYNIEPIRFNLIN